MLPCEKKELINLISLVQELHG